MKKRRLVPRRSAAEWSGRLALAAGVAVIGYGAVSHTLAYATRGSAPERAYRLSPWDGRIAGVLATKLAGPDARIDDRLKADALARKALLRDPSAISAVATLGLDAQIRGDSALAARLFAYARVLSRRDLRTQLWAVEDAVSRGDIPGTLRNYDIALRTSRIASDLMFPVLSSAIDEASIRSALVTTLTGRPPWSEAFTDYLAGNAKNLKAAAALFGELNRAGVSVPKIAQDKLIASLFRAGLLEEGWAFYRVLHPQADRRMSRDARFAADNEAPSLFDWVPANDSGISASIQRGEGGGVLDFAVAPSVSGVLLTQVQMLPPGSYVLEGHSAGVDQPSESLPYWTLSCFNGPELGRVPVTNSAQSKGFHKGSLVVPAGCQSQTLSLVARPSDMVSGVSGQIDWVQVRPAH